MAGPFVIPQPEILPEADPLAPRCLGCEHPMVIHEKCPSIIRPAHACVHRECPEFGCKPCTMLARWFTAQNEALDDE